MGQTYIDPVNTYMEKFFNTGYFSIASVFPIVRVYQSLCKGKQVGNYSQARVIDLFLSFITDSERMLGSYNYRRLDSSTVDLAFLS
jgi:hypothetical protein